MILIALVAVSLVDIGQATWIFTGLAGGTTVGNVNGPAANARFETYSQVGSFANNVFYIADSGNNGVKAFNKTSGNVSLLAGSPPNQRYIGCNDGTGSNARFNSPQSLALTIDGSALLVVDSGNNCIRTISMSGAVSTFAGTCSNAEYSSDKCGGAPFVSLNNPTSIAIIGSVQYGSTAFVADPGNCRIVAIPLAMQTNAFHGNVSDLVTFRDGFSCLESPMRIASSVLTNRIYFSTQDVTSCYLHAISVFGENITNILSMPVDMCGQSGLIFVPSSDGSSLIIWDQNNLWFQFVDAFQYKTQILSRDGLSSYPAQVWSLLSLSDGSLAYMSGTALQQLSNNLNCGSLSSCANGTFRSCSVGFFTGNCANCSNAPEDSKYSSNGVPSNANNCSWICNTGYSRDTAVVFGAVEPVCAKCRVFECLLGQYLTNCTATVNSRCENCSDPLPPDASYTRSCSNSQTAEESLMKNAWVCNSGFYRNKTAFDCVECPKSPCDIGQYRGPCGNDTSGCINCTGLVAHAYFTGPGFPFDMDNCSWLCLSGYYRSGHQCLRCNNSLCSAGRYRGPCGDFSDAPCLRCTNPIPQFANYTNNCTSNGTISMLQTWICSNGYYTQGFRCVACSKAFCQIGFYHGPCNDTLDGISRAPTTNGSCTPCANGPANSKYIGPGNPYNRNNCNWQCADNYYLDGEACAPCLMTLCSIGMYRTLCVNGSRNQSWCANCTNGPRQAIYTGQGYLNNSCNFTCNHGYFRSADTCVLCNSSLCTPGMYRGPCGAYTNAPCLTCTNPKPPFSSYTSYCNASFSDYSNPGKLYCALRTTWVCNVGYYYFKDPVSQNCSCALCPSTVCNIGLYRSTCSGTSNGTCVSCTNTIPINSQYGSGGIPFNSNNCSWVCSKGYFIFGGGCKACNSSACPAGQYRGPCNNTGSEDAVCVPCVGAPPNGYYTYGAVHGPRSPDSAQSCNWTCNSGYFISSASASGICSPCNTSNCKIGQFRNVSTCRDFSDAKCVSCNNRPSFSNYTGYGIPYNVSTCTWQCNSKYFSNGTVCLPCTTSPCPTGLFRGPCSSTADAMCLNCSGAPANSHYASGTFAHAATQPDTQPSCTWTCNTGYYINTTRPSGGCVPCNTSTCNIGYYRNTTSCSGFQNAICVPCSNKPLFSSYTGAGIPHNISNCSWICNANFFQNASVCNPCSTDFCPVGQYRDSLSCFGFQDASCVNCTNGPRDLTAFDYTSFGIPYNQNLCSYKCHNNTFTSGPNDEQCRTCNESFCPVGQYRGLCSEYADAPCLPCNTSSCSIGHYRAQCQEYSDSRCVPCNNSATHANYLGPGIPFDEDNCAWECPVGYDLVNHTCIPCNSSFTSNFFFIPHLNNCSWECNSGYFKSGSVCEECNSSQCSIGFYRLPCGNDYDSVCVQCTNKQGGSHYTSSGGLSNACNWTCSIGNYREGSVENGTCKGCTTTLCDIPGKYRGECGVNFDAPCIDCTSFLPQNAMYTIYCTDTANDYLNYNGLQFRFNESTAPWVCNSGYYRSNFIESAVVNLNQNESNISNSERALLFLNFDTYSTRFCVACNISYCGIGEYRSSCTPEKEGICVSCTNNPANSSLLSSGIPFDQNNCQWSCLAGFYASQGSCVPCSRGMDGQICPGCGQFWDGFCIPAAGNLSAKLPSGQWTCGPGVYPIWSFEWQEYGRSWSDGQELGALNQLVGTCEGNCSARPECSSTVAQDITNNLSNSCKPLNPMTYYVAAPTPGFPASVQGNICPWRCVAGHFWDQDIQNCTSCENFTCPSAAQYISECTGLYVSCDRCGFHRPRNSYVTKRGPVPYAKDCLWEPCQVKSCPLGQHYFECSELATEDDSYCANKAIPTNAQFIAEGTEQNGFVASWVCNAGFYASNGSVCLQCTKGCSGCGQFFDGGCNPPNGKNSQEVDPTNPWNLNDYVCGPGTYGIWQSQPWYEWPYMICSYNCTNAPNNSHYLPWPVGSSGSNTNSCPWECNAGYYLDLNSTCLSCSTASCPVGNFIAECLPSGLVCRRCSLKPPVGTNFTTSGSCGFRNDCSWNCTSCNTTDFCTALPLPFVCPPLEYKMGLTCLLCSTAPCPPRTYREPCILSNRSIDSRCLSCVNDPCPTGFYRPQCISNNYHKCVPCTYKLGNTKDSVIFYTSGQPYDNDNCSFMCNFGYFGLNNHLCNICSKGLFTSAPGSQNCSICSPGTYSNRDASSSCSVCVAGKYQNNIQGTVCINCTFGFFSSSSGTSVCIKCPAGSFTMTTGLSSCATCAVGTYGSANGVSSCLTCDVGLIASGTGFTACTQCQWGTYGNSNGLTVCSSCDSGQFAAVSGASVCIDCPLGLFNNNSGLSSCLLCQYGKYGNASGKTVCDDCDVGKYVNISGSSICELCAPGRFADSIGAVVCSECQIGKYTNTSGSSACAGCPLGAYCNQTSSTQCFLCPASKYNNDTAASGCFDCPSESTSQPGSLQISSCICDAGYWGNLFNCTACTPGTYQSSPGSENCSECNSGTYVNVSSATTCTNCPAGQYASIQGSRMCASCGVGTYGTGLGHSLCLDCPLGLFNNNSGLSSCLLCQYGKYGNASGKTVCDDCDVGKYVNISGSSICELCAPGRFADSIGAVVCSECQIGKYTNTSGSSACAGCPLGAYCNQTSSTQCFLCPASKYNNDTAASGCFDCPSESTSQPGSLQISSCICDAGYWGNLFNCTACTPGTYQSSPGSENCSECNSGTYVNVSSATTCTNCPAGQYASIQGSRMCASCGVGTYGTGLGHSLCLDCPLGLFASSTGCTKCLVCHLGMYANTTSMTACLDCLAGTYSNTTGATICFHCGAGTFSNSSGSTVCISCVNGTNSTIEGATSCL